MVVRDVESVEPARRREVVIPRVWVRRRESGVGEVIVVVLGKDVCFIV